MKACVAEGGSKRTRRGQFLHDVTDIRLSELKMNHFRRRPRAVRRSQWGDYDLEHIVVARPAKGVCPVHRDAGRVHFKGFCVGDEPGPGIRTRGSWIRM